MEVNSRRTGSIAAQIQMLRRRIGEMTQNAGRKQGEVDFILVSKTVGAEKIMEAYQEGVRDFGENRVQELLEKKAQLPGPIRWHMIGHLQTNKVRKIAGEAVLIHSLDRPELAEVLHREAESRNIEKIDCLIQVNSSGEVSKSGLPSGEVENFVSKLADKVRIRIRGLMTIGPLTDNAEKIRRAFRSVRELREKLAVRYPEKDWSILSMGMSGDYPIAIEEGATLLRIGTAVFGARSGNNEN